MGRNHTVTLLCNNSIAQLTSKIQVCAINGTNFFLIHSLCTLWGCKLYGTPAFMLGMQVQYQPQILHRRTEKHTVEWKSIENYWIKTSVTGFLLFLSSFSPISIFKTVGLKLANQSDWGAIPVRGYVHRKADLTRVRNTMSVGI